MDEVRVLIVDDSAFVRRAVTRMLGETAGIEIVGSADNGADAVTRVKELQPDVVILDVHMPHLDGLEALQRIMAEAPTKVLMLSTHTSEGAHTTLTALEMGAVDFVDKAEVASPMDIYSLGPILREKVFAVAGAEVRSPKPSSAAAPPGQPEEEPSKPQQHVVACPFDVVVMGASTGGPGALTELIGQLPAWFPPASSSPSTCRRASLGHSRNGWIAARG